MAWETNVPIAPQYKDAAEAAHNRGEQAAIKAAGGHPLIGKRDFDRQRFAEASADNAPKLILDYISTRKKDIATIRSELKDPDFIWNPSLGDLRTQANLALGVVPGSIQDLIVKDRVSSQERRVFLSNLALAVLAAALTAISLGAGAGVLAVAAGVTAGVISGSQAYASYIEYESSAAAYHTGFAADDPSFIWVVVAVVGAGMDIATVAVPILRTQKPLVSRFNLSPARNLARFEAEVAQLSDANLPPSVRQRVLDAARKEAAGQLSLHPTLTSESTDDPLARLVRNTLDQRGMLGLRSGGSGSGVPSEVPLLSDVSHIKQCTPTGCGPASGAKASGYHAQITPGSRATSQLNLLNQPEYSAELGGMDPFGLAKALEREAPVIGRQWTVTDPLPSGNPILSAEQVQTALEPALRDGNGVVIVNTIANEGTANAYFHWVVVREVRAGGLVLIHDPEAAAASLVRITAKGFGRFYWTGDTVIANIP